MGEQERSLVRSAVEGLMLDRLSVSRKLCNQSSAMKLQPLHVPYDYDYDPVAMSSGTNLPCTSVNRKSRP